jgi:hypothetical protein
LFTFVCMEYIEYNYWEINYISCEGNKRWTVVRTPIDWEEYDVRDRVPMGGCGDDVSEIIEIFETNNNDYGWDFSE